MLSLTRVMTSSSHARWGPADVSLSQRTTTNERRCRNGGLLSLAGWLAAGEWLVQEATNAMVFAIL